ncbi:MAG: YciI family protein [Gaiellaceae bacterium]
MKFLLLLHGDADAEAALPRDERMKIVDQHMAYTTMLEEAGVYVTGVALDDPKSSVVVRPGEKPIVTDGPFAETKEAVGGLYVVDVADRDEAVRLAGQVPRSPGLAVEVLAIIDY